MLLCDFHIHTNLSDGKLSLREIVDFYGRSGFDAIAITDHLCEQESFLGKTAHFLSKSVEVRHYEAYVAQIEYEAERAKALYDMIVIPGVEFTKNSFRHDQSAHVLGLGVRNYISCDYSIESICNQVESQGGVRIAAHPVSTQRVEPQTYHLWNHKDHYQHYFDAWEVASGPVLFDQVVESSLPKIANSDLHSPRQMNSWKTLVNSEKSEPAILEAIKKQNIEFYFFNKGGHQCNFN